MYDTNLFINFDGHTGRAIFVAALAVSVWTLVRYRQSLHQETRAVRRSLLVLRGATLLLMSCLMAGARVEYQTVAPARVLLGVAHQERADADSQENVKDDAVPRVIATLNGGGLDVVKEDENAAEIDESSRSFAAAILLTDGAMSAERARVAVEQLRKASGGAAVNVLLNMKRSSAPRVSVESVAVSGKALRGVPVAVRGVVHGRGMRGRESLLTVSDDAKVQSSARVLWKTDDEWQTVSLEVVPKVAGWMDYVARIEPAGNEEAATLSREFALKTEERRMRVLFFEGEPTWEAKFIRRALEASGLFEVDYLAQVSRAATAGVSEKTEEQEALKESESARKNVETAKLTEASLHETLSGPARLNSYDCIIVGATPDALLSSTEAARLRAWTERRGGGLIVLGSNAFAGSIAAPQGKLYALMPAEIDARGLTSDALTTSRSAPVSEDKQQRGVALTPTEKGAGGALRGYLKASETDAAVNASVLTGQGFRLSGLRAGASVLAVAGQANEEGVSEAGTPLIVAARYGAGRALVFAPADSWRIRTNANEAENKSNSPFDALWQGLVLWSSANANAPVILDLSAEGNSVTAEINARDASFAPLKIEKLSAHVQPLFEDEEKQAAAQEIAFAPDENEQSVWRGRFQTPARGRWELQVDYVAGGKVGNVSKQFTVFALKSLEAGAARDTLQRTARETGGELYSIMDAKALAENLTGSKRHFEPVSRAWEMRTFWPLAIIISLLLSTEWLIRKAKVKR
ncbi:MAG: hypothetical protein WBP93_18750 [Pyrinomonadaceae bacterium]